MGIIEMGEGVRWSRCSIYFVQDCSQILTHCTCILSLRTFSDLTQEHFPRGPGKSNHYQACYEEEYSHLNSTKIGDS